MKKYPSKKALGKAGEDFAGNYLEKRGLEILERNFRIREGEIDLIALDGDTIVFVEVKTRKSKNYGLPSEAVDEVKQEKIREVAEAYLAEKGWMERIVRFDVFSIRYNNERKNWHIKWYKQAF